MLVPTGYPKSDVVGALPNKDPGAPKIEPEAGCPKSEVVGASVELLPNNPVVAVAGFPNKNV